MIVQPRSARSPHPTLLVTVAGACVAFLGACNRNDETAKAVKSASREVNMIGGGGGPAASPQFERTKYSEAISTLAPVTDKGLAEEQAAALVITAQSQMGLAAEPAGAAAAVERESLDRMTVIRSLLGDWLTTNARAAALDEFNPAPVLADIGKSVGEKDKNIAEQQAIKAKLDAQISGLRTQAAEKSSGAKAEENQYAELKQQSSKLRPTDAEPLIRRAAEHKKKSDELRNAGALLEARAAQIDRSAAEAQLLIDQYTNQKANLEATGKSLRDKLDASKKEAASARAEGAKSGERLDSLVAELRTLRSGPLVEATENAAKNYRTAASTASKASSGDQNGGSKLTVGAAQQALGDLQWSRAQGQAAYAQLLQSLAAATPALPKSAEYEKEAADVLAARQESLKAAQEAYSAAQNAYGAVRTKGEARERLEQLAKSLEGLAKVASGEVKDLEAAMKSLGAADSASAAPADSTPVPETPVAATLPTGVTPELAAAVETLLASVKSGDQTAVIEMMYFPAGSENLKAPLSQIAGAVSRLDKACRAKFNSSFADAMKQALGGAAGGAGMGASMGGPNLTPEQVQALTIADLQFAINGDNANVTVPGATTPIEFVRVDGKWLVDAKLAGNPQAAMLPTLAGPLVKIFDDLSADVESGALADTRALGQAFMQKAATLGGGPGGG